MDKCSGSDEDEHNLEFVDDFDYGWVFIYVPLPVASEHCVA